MKPFLTLLALASVLCAFNLPIEVAPAVPLTGS